MRRLPIPCRDYLRLPSLLLILSSGCATTYTIVPAKGQPVAEAHHAGLTLIADAAVWEASPHDLPSYLTPIWVEIVNRTKDNLVVSYADFSLIDERGFRYAAINPYTGRALPPPPPASAPAKPAPPASAPVKPAPPASAPAEPAPRHEGESVENQTAPSPVLLASLEPVALGSRSSRVRVHKTADRRIARRGHPRRGYHRYPRRGSYGRRYPRGGFYVYPRSHLYFHYYAPWPGLVYYPPYYHMYVHTWGAPYYPYPPTDEIRDIGLPEGVVKPGGGVSGYVYFQNATRRGKHLILSWQARTPGGASVATLDLRFKIVPM